MRLPAFRRAPSEYDEAFMDTMAVLGGWANADTGLSLGMLGGGQADPPSACVPRSPKPMAVMPPKSTTFTTAS